MNSFFSRLLIGIFGIILILSTNYYNYWLFGILLLIILLLSGFELYKMLNLKGFSLVLYLLPLFFISSLYFKFLMFPLCYLWIISIFLILFLFKFKEASFLYSIYLIIPFILLFLIRKNFGEVRVFILFLTVWSMDTVSYYIGTFLGKLKIVPLISPNKTLEGTISGIISSAIVFVFLNKIFGYLTPIYYFIAIILPISGFFGDLFESFIKRKCNVKDSGSLLMGHGGVLDRFDSILFMTIVYFFYLSL